MAVERDRVKAIIRSTGDRHEDLKQLVALGLMVVRKWDCADMQHGMATRDQAAQYDSFTPAEFSKFTDDANLLLRDYVAFVPRAERDSYWYAVGQGLVSAFLYSIFLIVVAILVRLGGHDLIDILRDALKPD